MKSSGAPSAAKPPNTAKAIVVLTAVVFIAIIAWTIPDNPDPRRPCQFVLGIALGATLYLSSFGFAGAYRNFLTQGRVDGILAQFLMISVATALFAPALSAGELFGSPVIGAYAPLSVQAAIGAALFGIGTQLAGGCGSGTLFAIGGGSLRMLVVLAFFCASSFLASLHMDVWQNLPSAGVWILGDRIGWAPAATLQISLLGALGFLLWRKRRAGASPSQPTGFVLASGTRQLLIGALALAGLNFATLSLAGHPWSITRAFTLWGAKSARLAGWEPSESAFWQSDFQLTALNSSIFMDTTSIMNIGIVLGSIFVAALAGRFAPRVNLTRRNLVTAIAGGLAMGYGSRISYGCNIGAFFSGAASTSLHGWLWFFSALAGCSVGIKLADWIDRPESRSSSA